MRVSMLTIAVALALGAAASAPLLASLELASRALAHEGHGSRLLAGSVLHDLLEPEHLPSTLLVAGSVALASKLVANLRRRRTARTHRH